MPGPRGNRMVAPQKVENPGKTIKRLMSYMGKYKGLLGLVVLFILMSSGAQILGTSFLQRLIDDYLTPLLQGYDAQLLAQLAKVLGVMLGIYLIGAAGTYLYSRIMLTISTDTLYNLRVDMFNRMEDLPIRYFDRTTHGEIMSRYTNDTDAVRQLLSNSIASFISSAITVISVFCVMLYYSWHLTLIVVAMLVVMLKVVSVIGGRSGAYFVKQQRSLGKLNGYIEELIEGQKVVKVFCHEDQSKAAFDLLNEEMCQASTNANTFANILMPIMGNLSHVLYAIVAIAGGVLSISGVLSLGTVVAFLQYTRSFSQPITQVSQQFNSVLAALAGAERIFKLIDEPVEEDGGYVTLEKDQQGMPVWRHPHHDGTVTYTPVQGGVVFSNVTFGYDPDKVVLDDISLYAKPGQKIAFVGSTGAGKTTITNLINRFYDVPDGKIRYDGINICKIKKPDLRRSMAMVLQDTHLFTDTVRENIRYGNLEATDQQVEDAAKRSGADGFIRRLPQGYDTILTADGSNLSQGQRQLLAIARAAVADPPVLVLDEATSSIDTRTEALVEKGMDQLMEGRTVFVIAHRLSTVRNANAIMVLEHGKIIERGSHEDLLAQKGKYYQLYTGAFELT
ncbi:MAG TPA: ABC transporter ATP-binding protein [Candidatus Excrementavichristensenella intestinipullorum]|nr:ABC transporter ATP-binding protein [Candidatus Excrementavichristensenella intestinipullorum]